MEDSILSSVTNRKIYSQKGIMIGGILAGPVAVGYLMTRNCKALNIPERMRQVWLICLGAFVVLFAIAIVVPPQVPTFVFIFLNAAFGYYAAENLQGKMINAHVAEGGQLHSNWRGAGIAFIFTLAFIAIFLAAFLAMDIFVTKPII
jgi:uncharacterized membrane protein YbaN (DUF454 family)